MAAQGTPLLLQLLEQHAVDVALPSVLRHQVPEVADLLLADTVDPAEALLDPVGVPRKVVVDEEVGLLQVHPLSGGVGRHHDRDIRVLAELILESAALFPMDPAVDGDNGLGTAEVADEAADQVSERVAVLGEDDELASSVARRPKPVEQSPELHPLGIRARLSNAGSQLLQIGEGGDLGAQLSAGERRRGLVDDRLLDLLGTVALRLDEIRDVLVLDELLQALDGRTLDRRGSPV